MNTEQERALLPCPFCGGKVILCGNEHPTMRMIHVLCPDCETSGGSHKFHKEATLAWNRRAALQSPEVQALRKDAERYRLLRRGQHWSVTDGIGDTLRVEALDVAIDAVLEKK